MTPYPANMYADLLRNDLCAFIHRSFLALNPRKPFLDNWHIELLAAKLEIDSTGANHQIPNFLTLTLIFVPHFTEFWRPPEYFIPSHRTVYLLTAETAATERTPHSL